MTAATAPISSASLVRGCVGLCSSSSKSSNVSLDDVAREVERLRGRMVVASSSKDGVRRGAKVIGRTLVSSGPETAPVGGRGEPPGTSSR